MNWHTVGGIATWGFGALLATPSISAAVAQESSAQYSVLERISGPGCGCDYATIDAASRQLYLGRDEGVL